MPRTPKRKIEGSERKALPQAKPAGKADPKEWIEVTVMVRPRQAAAPGTRYTHEEIADHTGADPADFAKLERFAHDHRLTVTLTSIPQRIMKLQGTLGDLSKAFGANVKRVRVGNLVYRGRTGSLSVPDGLADIIVGVFGFTTTPVARPHYRALDAVGGGTLSTKGPGQKKAAAESVAFEPHAKKPGLKPFTPPEVAKLYGFPTGLDGKGQCVAIIELNTPNDQQKLGTGYSTPDLKTYFKKLGIAMPAITAVGVSGGANLPGINLDADGEVMLDVEVVGAIAPGAHIAVYFAPNTSQGFIDALNAAVHDVVRKPSVVSISWGGPEDAPYTTAQMRKGMEQVLQDAMDLGVTVCCASGDDGSADLPPKNRDGKPHVDFPASSALALACGGTALAGSGSTITAEFAWNEGDPSGPSSPSGAGGGGVSNFAKKPAYQSSLAIPKSPKGFTGRGVPDVAGNADSASGYLCKLQGIPQLVPIGGTSAVAPLWSALLALVNEKRAQLGKKSVGFANPLLYQSAKAFRDITVGSNDIDGTLKVYKTASGWDPCTGMGSPDGAKILAALTA